MLNIRFPDEWSIRQLTTIVDRILKGHPPTIANVFLERCCWLLNYLCDSHTFKILSFLFFSSSVNIVIHLKLKLSTKFDTRFVLCVMQTFKELIKKTHEICMIAILLNEHTCNALLWFSGGKNNMPKTLVRMFNNFQLWICHDCNDGVTRYVLIIIFYQHLAAHIKLCDSRYRMKIPEKKSG